MTKHEQVKWKGTYEIHQGAHVTVIDNMITEQALNMLSGALMGEDVDLEIKYLVVGTGDKPVSSTDTALENEMVRVQAVVDTNRKSVGIVETEFILRDNEGNGDIREMGIVVGKTATQDPNTGFLISRINCNFTKTPNEEIIIKRIDGVM